MAGMGGGGGRKFRDLLSLGGGGGYHTFLEGRFFFYVLFCKLFFCESDITCIITFVGAQ